MTISKMLLDYFQTHADQYFSGPSSAITNSELLLTHKILNNESVDFLIFDNAGGRRFEIWDLTNRENKNDFIELFKGYAYAYKIDGQETIIKPLT
jgi:hypothetical protein